MSTATETVDLTRSEVAELRALEGRLRAEERLLRLAGQADCPRAVEARELRRAVHERLEGWHDAQSAEQTERIRRDTERESEIERQRVAAAAELDAAVEFLTRILAERHGTPIAREEIEATAAAEGIGSTPLLAAARTMGLKAGRQYTSGNKLAPGEFWARQFWAGYRASGPVG